jgi:3'(2'), 5'-bisphosphate nucleotidase
MSISPDALATLLPQATQISKLAGARVLEFFLPEVTVSHKQDQTPLTDADLAANKIIISKLQTLDPVLPIITEESCDIPLEERAQWQAYWLVDPLDGTREFIRQNGEFSVNIALVHRGRPVLGVIHAPVLDITYWASTGAGAWKQAGDDTPRRINVRIAPADQGVTVALGWSARFGDRLQRFLDKLGNHRELRMGGALKSCLVAEGRADVYPCLGPTGEWDTAAAQCIVEEAGGTITDTRSQPLQYNKSESMINPDFVVSGAGKHAWLEYLD